jgi:hypothetical protein
MNYVTRDLTFGQIPDLRPGAMSPLHVPGGYPFEWRKSFDVPAGSVQNPSGWGRMRVTMAIMRLCAPAYCGTIRQ